VGKETMAIKASVSAGHGAEGAKKAADDMMGAEDALEQVKDGSCVVGLEQMAKPKMGRPNRKEFVASSHHKTELDSVHRLSWFILLLAISDCEAMTLPGYSSLRMDSHSHTAPSLAVQLGNHSISQYASCQGALWPIFIRGLLSSFVFGCGLCLLIWELNKTQHQRFVSKGCTLILWWFVLCSAVFFVLFLGFTITCNRLHVDKGIDEAFYITAFVAVLLLLISFLLTVEKNSENWDLEDVDKAQITGLLVFSVLVVCTGLFTLFMVLHVDTIAGEALGELLFLSGVWCIGWALWWCHCSIYVEAIHIKDEECGDSIPFNVTGLTQVASLLFNTYSFAGFSFAPSIPWTHASSSINFAPILAPVTQWYANYVSIFHRT
jgi:hypothetical protein